MATRKTTATTTAAPVAAKPAAVPPAAPAPQPAAAPAPAPVAQSSDHSGDAPAGAWRARVRMYRQGLGDCFLITLPRQAGNPHGPYYVVIDCGVILGTENASDKMEKVVQDIIATTGGRIDLLLATHEHWDHLSGFVQAQDLWQKSLHVGEVWVGWTEDPNDKLAQTLQGDSQAMRMGLAAAAGRLRMAGSDDAASEVAGMLEFFGAAGSSTSDALAVVKKLSSNLRFCLPQDAPVALEGTGVTAYVLGPPHDEKLLKQCTPSATGGDAYGADAMAAFGAAAAPPDADGDGLNAPFDDTFHIPLDAAKQVQFFQDRYWGENADSSEKDQSWRRIDGSWLDMASGLALQLDSATNNTSLVVALEIPGGEVLLFAADAQAGNWISWQNLSWSVNGKNVTGPDLLNRTVFYKVGHHGSHNATLRAHGLEEMKALQATMIPVDHAMALKKRWGAMPLPELVQRLGEVTAGRVIRTDEPVPATLSARVRAEADLYYEITF